MYINDDGNSAMDAHEISIDHKNKKLKYKKTIDNMYNFKWIVTLIF